MVSTLLRALTAQLADAGNADAAFDVHCMLGQVTGRDYRLVSAISPAQEEALRALVRRRAEGEPLQYLLGEWEFYGLRLFVGKGVLIPRPDTETLVDTILSQVPEDAPLRILDLCTGSGCIALALAKHLPLAEVHALDYSERALDYFHKNRALHDLPVTAHAGDVREAETAAAFRDFDVIVSNPPYLTAEEMASLQREVAHEPALALAGGTDGLRFYRDITRLWKASLRPGGILAYEVGDRQAQDVRALLEAGGFRDVQIVPDPGGLERVVWGRKASRGGLGQS